MNTVTDSKKILGRCSKYKTSSSEEIYVMRAICGKQKIEIKALVISVGPCRIIIPSKYKFIKDLLLCCYLFEEHFNMQGCHSI